MMSRFSRISLMLSLMACTILSCALSCAGNLTDAEKLSAVYRMYERYKEGFPQVKDISPGEARELLSKEKALFIDTRTQEETDVAMLPGAITEKEYYAAKNKYPGKVPIAYCTISYRSGIFSVKESSEGAPVRNLRGGLLAWVLEGGAVYDKTGKETRRIHVYGWRWDYPPAGYTSVY